MVHDFNSLQQFFRDQNVFSRFGFDRIGVFGSFARGEKFNDIDILIEERLDYNTRMTLQNYLEAQLNVPVDIVFKDYAEPIILFRALKDVKYATAS